MEGPHSESPNISNISSSLADLWMDALKWNEPSIAFYEKRLGAHPQNEWLGERLEGDEEIGRLEAFLQ
jgi:hypothetical protein